jgi:hypothetical protein
LRRRCRFCRGSDRRSRQLRLARRFDLIRALQLGFSLLGYFCALLGLLLLLTL